MADALLSRLEAAVTRLEAVASRGGGGGEGKSSASVDAYDGVLSGPIEKFLVACNGIAGLEKLAAGAKVAFTHLKVVLQAAAECKAPAPAELMKFADPIVKVVGDAQNCDNRSPLFQHLKAYAEMIQLMNALFHQRPGDCVEATLEAADFYFNKVLKLAKDDAEKNGPELTASHRAFVSSSKETIKALTEYFKEFHKMGIAWNVKGKPIAEFHAGGGGGGSVPAAPPAAPAGVPPPPPVGVLPPDAPAAAPKPAGGGGLGAVFGELTAKGAAGTATEAFGLKKVTKEMKMELKAQPTVEPVKKADVAPAKKWGAAASAPAAEEKKPSSKTLKQGTWFVENFENIETTVEDVQMKQNIYIYNCNNAVVFVNDKCKSIQMDKCTKTKVVFPQVVSVFEVVNSKRSEVHVKEACASITVDKSSGITVVLYPESVKSPPQVVTANSAEVIISIPGDPDPVELPIPEQLLTVIKDGKLHTEAILHKG